MSFRDALIDEPKVVNSTTTAVPTISAEALPAVRARVAHGVATREPAGLPTHQRQRCTQHGGCGTSDNRTEHDGADDQQQRTQTSAANRSIGAARRRDRRGNTRAGQQHTDGRACLRHAGAVDRDVAHRGDGGDA